MTVWSDGKKKFNSCTVYYIKRYGEVEIEYQDPELGTVYLYFNKDQIEEMLEMFE